MLMDHNHKILRKMTLLLPLIKIPLILKLQVAIIIVLYFSFTESFIQKNILQKGITSSLKHGHDYPGSMQLHEHSSDKVNAWMCSPSLKSERRKFVLNSLIVLIPSILGLEDAKAAQGAAEYDLEYYLRDLVSGNRKEGARGSSKPPTLPPPRKLNGLLASRILNKECTASCIVIQSLSEYASLQTVQDKIEIYRSKSKLVFQSRLNWSDEDVTDQYYFDFLSYATWRAAADLIPSYVDRQAYVRTIGRYIWKHLQTDYKPSKSDDAAGTAILSNIAASKLTYALNSFQTANFILDYSFSNDSSPKSNTNNKIPFDSYDDQDFMDGNTLTFIISIISPPTLYSSLQITAEGSRFSPEFIGTTLAAALEDATNGKNKMKVQYETYFVDREYRPNPKDYFPDEQLLQFTIVRANN